MGEISHQHAEDATTSAERQRGEGRRHARTGAHCASVIRSLWMAATTRSGPRLGGRGGGGRDRCGRTCFTGAPGCPSSLAADVQLTCPRQPCGDLGAPQSHGRGHRCSARCMPADERAAQEWGLSRLSDRRCAHMATPPSQEMPVAKGAERDRQCAGAACSWGLAWVRSGLRNQSTWSHLQTTA